MEKISGQAGKTAASSEGVVKTIAELIGQQRIAVHNGPFHADDVVCVALLKSLGFKGEVVRTRDAEVLKDLIGIDVSGSRTGGQFDHHGEYAAPGTCALTKLLEFCSGNEAVGAVKATFSKDFEAVAGVDSGAVDPAKIDPSAFSWVHLAAAAEKADTDRGFIKAVETAEMVLRMNDAEVAGWREFVAATLEAVADVKELGAPAVGSGSVHVPAGCEIPAASVTAWAEAVAAEWATTLAEARAAMTWDGTPPVINIERAGTKEALWRLGCDSAFFVSPHGTHEWAVVQTCPKDNPFSPFGCSRYLPKEWAGLRGEELQKVSGYQSAIFAFAPNGETVMVFFSSKEDAVKCAEEACK